MSELSINTTRRSFLMGTGAGLVGLPLFGGGAAQAAYPEKDRDVTIVVHASAGGGSDIFARTIVKIATGLNLVSRFPLVENRVGGSGAVGYSYVAGKKGNPYFLGTIAGSFFTLPLLKRSPVSPPDFTPVAALALDPYVLVVNSKSSLTSLDDLKKKGMLIATATGNTGDHVILSAMLKEKLGIEIRVVPFNGSGEEMASVLGSHSDIMWGNPTEIMPQLQIGAMRAIAVTTEKRLKSLPDVPSLREQGLDIELIQMRALVMPKDVPQEAVKYWVDVLKKVSDSEEWRTGYIDKYLVEPMFLAGDELKKRVDDTSQMYQVRLKNIGAIK